MARISTCSHEFCEFCLLDYMEERLKNFEIIGCPRGDCEGKIDKQSGLFVTMTSGEKDKYKKIEFRKFAE